MNKKTATFNMRMEPEKKQRMDEFFTELGLSLAYGVNIFFEKCIIEGGLPFDLKLTGEKKLQELLLARPNVRPRPRPASPTNAVIWVDLFRG